MCEDSVEFAAPFENQHIEGFKNAKAHYRCLYDGGVRVDCRPGVRPGRGRPGVESVLWWVLALHEQVRDRVSSGGHADPAAIQVQPGLPWRRPVQRFTSGHWGEEFVYSYETNDARFITINPTAAELELGTQIHQFAVNTLYYFDADEGLTVRPFLSFGIGGTLYRPTRQNPSQAIP